MLPTTVESCEPVGCAVVSFWHPATEAPLTKIALQIANEASIFRLLTRVLAVTCSLFVKRLLSVTAVTTHAAAPIERVQIAAGFSLPVIHHVVWCPVRAFEWSVGRMTDVGTRSFAEYLSGVDESSLTALLQARPDVLVQPVPRGFSQLAQRLGGAGV